MSDGTSRSETGEYGSIYVGSTLPDLSPLLARLHLAVLIDDVSGGTSTTQCTSCRTASKIHVSRETVFERCIIPVPEVESGVCIQMYMISIIKVEY